MSGEAYIGKAVGQGTLNAAKSSLLESDEELACVIRGLLSGSELGSRKSGLLLITNKRVLFYQPKVFGGSEYTVFPYDQISAVNSRRSFVMDKLEMTVGSDCILMESVRKGDGSIAVQAIREMADRAAALKAQSSAVAGAPPQVDIADQIEKLGKLKEKGLLTEEEFEQKKKELLERL